MKRSSSAFTSGQANQPSGSRWEASGPMARRASTARSKNRAAPPRARSRPFLVATTRPWVTRTTPAFLAQANTSRSPGSRPASSEGAVADLLVHDVAGAQQVDQGAGIGQGELARLGELAALADVLSQCREHRQDGRLGLGRGHLVHVGWRHRWQGRPRRPGQVPVGDDPAAIVLRAGLNSAIHSCIPCGSDMSTPSAEAALNSDLAIPKFAASPMAATNRSVIEAVAAARAGAVDEPGASDAWSSRKAAKAANEAGMELQACDTLSLRGHQSSRNSPTSAVCHRSRSPSP